VVTLLPLAVRVNFHRRKNMSDSKRNDSWHSILDLSWLRVFLTCITNANNSKSHTPEDVASACRALLPIVDRYVSVIENYPRGGLPFSDPIEDCLILFEDWINNLYDLDPESHAECISAEILQIIRRTRMRGLGTGYLLGASPMLAKLTDEEIRDLARNTVDNVSAIRTLSASLIQ
jgi:hypothetical protein